MIALPRSATKALKLWSWKDTHGVVDTREDGLADKGMSKSSFDVQASSPEELKVQDSEPIENEVVAPVVRSHSKLVKRRDPSGNESRKETVPPVPVPDPATTADDVPSRPATPSTVHAPPSVDSETAEHVIVPSNPPRSPTPKHNVLVKKNSLSKRAAAKSAAPEAPPELPSKDADVPVITAEPLDGAVLDDHEAAGGDDTAAVEAPAGLPDSTLRAESGSEIEAEPETPAQSLPFPVRGSTPPNGTRFFEGTDGELEPIESRTTGTGGTMSGRARHIRPARPQRRISLRSFGFFYGKDSRPAHAFPAYVPPTERVVYEGVEPEAEVEVGSSSQPARARVHKRSNSLIPIGLLGSRKPAAPKVAKTDKRAIESALSLRTLIIGPAALDPNTKDKGKRPSDPKASAALALRKVNQQLLVPAEANRVIAALRELPPPDLPPATAERVETVRRKKGRMFGRGTRGEEKHKEVAKESEGTVAVPIHGCCLDMIDEEAEARHFSKLTGSRFSAQGSQSALTGAGANIASADLSSLIPVLRDMRLVNLQTSPDMSSVNAASLSADLTAPDLGFGQSADKSGPLAGSVPSAGSLADGMEKVGQTLMSLGFATTTAVLPSHVGIHPPKDRMSVLTYWWGYEVVFPPPTMRYLGNVKSISGALLNFLTAFSLFSNGVREMLPFIRYIAQFIDFEWNAIKAQDKGRGVVCAATWVMPAALVPRPWDFVDPPVMSSKHTGSMTPGPAVQETFAPVMVLAADASALEGAEAVEARSGPASATEVRDGEAVVERGIEKIESLVEREEGVGSGTGAATDDIMTAASRHDDAEPDKANN